VKVCIWSDGTWTELENLGEFNHMSDDYEIREINTLEELEELEKTCGNMSTTNKLS
jgi:hypothetical protein